MSEKKEMSAAELYQWRQGRDEDGIKILSALNSIIDGLGVLQHCNDWEDITTTIGSSYMREIAERCDEIYDSDELMDISEKFETIRTLLFGDKINYNTLLEMLRDNVDKYGWTAEKSERMRKEKERLKALEDKTDEEVRIK